jgi:hypothetical protein
MVHRATNSAGRDIRPLYTFTNRCFIFCLYISSYSASACFSESPSYSYRRYTARTISQFIYKKKDVECEWAEIAQSVYGLPTGWTVRGSNPAFGEIFRTHQDRSWGSFSLLYNGYRVFPGGKAFGAWRLPLNRI